MQQALKYTPPEFSQDSFTDCFIAGLVLADKRHIWIRGREGMVEERRRMYRLNRFLHLVFLQTARDHPEDRDWMHFILRLRNQTSPGLIGAFDGVRDLFRSKLLTWTSQSPPFYEYYKLDMSQTTARSLLPQAPPLMRTLGLRAAKIYMKPFKNNW